MSIVAVMQAKPSLDPSHREQVGGRVIERKGREIYYVCQRNDFSTCYNTLHFKNSKFKLLAIFLLSKCL